MQTFRNTYTESQTDTTIITPASGKKIYIWLVRIGTGRATLNFLTSSLSPINDRGKGTISPPEESNSIGAIDEVLSLTCGANTTITILYDEL